MTALLDCELKVRSARCECDAYIGISHFSHAYAPCELVRFAPVRTFRTGTVAMPIAGSSDEPVPAAYS